MVAGTRTHGYCRHVWKLESFKETCWEQKINEFIMASACSSMFAFKVNEGFRVTEFTLVYMSEVNLLVTLGRWFGSRKEGNE